MKEITNKILRVEMINWENLIPFQPDNLKTLTSENYEKLKNSLIKNHFIAGFHVWENSGKYWILDGHHRKYVLENLKKEGYILPDKLPCNVVDVKSKREAIKFLLTYSSEYAHPDRQSISEFIINNELDFDELNSMIDLRHINIEELKLDLSSDIEFKEYDEKTADDVKHVECPQCGHEFPV